MCHTTVIDRSTTLRFSGAILLCLVTFPILAAMFRPQGPDTITPKHAPFGQAMSAPASQPSRLIVPLYVYPGTDWDHLVRVRQEFPTVPMIAVVNLYNGPGHERNAAYAAGINRLGSSGIIVAGYVYTSYAARSAAAISADINVYKSWYELDGIFFDEMSSLAASQPYYASLSDYARSVGFTLTIGIRRPIHRPAISMQWIP